MDLCPSKRPYILKRIKEERGANFNSNIDKLSCENLGCSLIATFGTETTKSAILSACRGYRSEQYPNGIDVDTAQFLSSLIPVERGKLWELFDVIYGNEEKDRKPVNVFVKEIQQFPGLLEIMDTIGGLKSKRSSHASGVILFDEDPYEFGAFMRTPKGEVITQFDLHTCEKLGMVKYDFLVTKVQDKLVETINLLQENDEVEPNLTLRQVYDKYLHPNILPIEEQKYWKRIQNVEVLGLFQFDTEVGAQAAKKIKPSSILEMADANGLMRLMAAEKGQETPMEKYVRFKNNINLWYQEMTSCGLTKEEQESLKPYFLKSHGVPPSQEQMMQMLMDSKICNFSLKDANKARKIIAKKKMSEIPFLHQQVLDQASSKKLGEYVWNYGVLPQAGYSFSIIHALAYSFIGFQTAYIATRWNPIYWNTASLIVESGSFEEDEEDEASEQGQKKRQTDYSKLAKALGEIIKAGAEISLIDINNSQLSFKPNIEKNQILFGLGALSGINDEVITKIIENRPYSGIADFMARCPLNKTQMISLIKAGAFDELEIELARELGIEPRYVAMAYYLLKVSEPKTKINLQNFNSLIQRNLIPSSLEFEKQAFEFNKYLKAYCKSGTYYIFNDICNSFYTKHFDNDCLEIINGLTCIKQKEWDKIYKKQMDSAREWIKDNQIELLNNLNEALFMDLWNKYAKGNLSTWEMEALCFYYHEHELAHVDVNKYGISNFFKIDEEPQAEYYFKRGDKQIPVWKTYKIIGTVIAKNDSKSLVSLLTPKGVVTVKFSKEYYSLYNRQISEKGEDGKKVTLEKGWFGRGNLLMVHGYRRGDQFVAKSYKHNACHQLYSIQLDENKTDMILTHERIDMEEGEN